MITEPTNFGDSSAKFALGAGSVVDFTNANINVNINFNNSLKNNFNSNHLHFSGQEN